MLGIRKHIALSFGVLDEVLTKNLLFVQYLHSKKLSSLLLFLVFVDAQLFNKIDHAERTLAKLHDCFEVLWSDEFLVFLCLSLELLI